MGEIDDAVAAIRSGRTAILPIDGAYRLATSPYRSEPVERLYALTGREPLRPAPIVAADLELLFECVPELRGRAGTIARAVLPGPYTLILSNPARRYRWLTGTQPDAIRVRVPEPVEPVSQVLAAVGAVATTGAKPGGSTAARTLDDVPEELRAKCAAVVDGGLLPGTITTTIDFTGPEPAVVKEGSAPAGWAIERALAALG